MRLRIKKVRGTMFQVMDSTTNRVLRVYGRQKEAKAAMSRIVETQKHDPWEIPSFLAEPVRKG
jgi:hypothetical protein